MSLDVAALHRHQLAWLTDAGWRALLDAPWDDEARACLAHWAGQRLPLVVTRQPPHLDAHSELALGLAAPSRWSRRRLALQVQRAQVARFGEFPALEALLPTLPTAWRGLCASLAALHAPTRVHGSHGWQWLSGLAYVHAHSDIDLCCAVDAAAHADAVAAALHDFNAAPRLDGELRFPDGRAVAWREWQAWRAGRCRALLVKTLHGASLVETWAAAMVEHSEALPC